jgi:hypothetical protein
MSLVTAAKNTMLDALTVTQASLHTAFPGLTGANEVTGGAPAYAKQSITFAAASAGARSTSGAAAFDVPACTVRWVGIWNGGTYLGYGPNGGSPKEFVVDPSTDTFRCTAHGLSDTNTIVFYNGTVPTGLTEGVVYYVRDAATDTFKVAATAGGAAIDITGAGSTDCLVSLIVESVYAAQGTHTLTTGTIGLPL